MLAHDGFKMVAVFRGEGDGGGSAAGHGEQLRAVKINLFSMMPHILKKRYQDFQSVPLEAFHGKIVSEELEREKGGSGLRYSFDIRRGSVTQEVGVDAKTGKVLENDREGPNPD